MTKYVKQIEQKILRLQEWKSENEYSNDDAESGIDYFGPVNVTVGRRKEKKVGEWCSIICELGKSLTVYRGTQL